MLVGACAAPHPPILIPEIGGPYLARVRATVEGLERLAAWSQALDPDLLLVMSPHGAMRAHAMGVSGAPRAAGDFGRFGAPDVRLGFANDSRFVRLLLQESAARAVPLESIDEGRAVYELDWGVTVPAYYLLGGARGGRVRATVGLVALTFSQLDWEDHRRFGQALAAAADRYPGRALFVASGDLSHRLKPGAPAGFDPAGADFDAQVVEALGAGDFDRLMALPDDLRVRAGECGFRSLLTLGGVVEGRLRASVVLSYEGPFGVGYPVATLDVTGVDGRAEADASAAADGGPDEEANPVLALARQALEAYVNERRIITPPDPLPLALASPAGCFVSLHAGGVLRGCLGTITPRCATLAEEIIENAIGAASRDYRFTPVQAHELEGLHCSVDVLGPLEPVQGPWQLDPVRYGLVVCRGSRTGVLLPDIEGVRDVYHQLELARHKAGITADESVELFRFQVTRHV